MAIGKDTRNFTEEWLECGAHGTLQNHNDIIRLELIELERWFDEHDYYSVTGTPRPRNKVKWHVEYTSAKPLQYLHADMWSALDGTIKK